MSNRRVLAFSIIAAVAAAPLAIAAEQSTNPNSTTGNTGTINSNPNSSSNPNSTSNPSDTSKTDNSSMGANQASTAGSPAALDVLAYLHHANEMEVKMGDLAEDKADAKAVKEYGERLQKDHKDAEKKVKDLAQNLSVKLPDEDKMMAEKDHASMKRLKALKGSAFDRAFLQAMARDHKKVIEHLQSAQKELGGSPVGELVSQVIPTLQEHEQIATDLLKNIPATDKQS